MSCPCSFNALSKFAHKILSIHLRSASPERSRGRAVNRCPSTSKHTTSSNKGAWTTSTSSWSMMSSSRSELNSQRADAAGHANLVHFLEPGRSSLALTLVSTSAKDCAYTSALDQTTHEHRRHPAIHFIADDQGAFTGALGMLFDASDLLGAPRSKVRTLQLRSSIPLTDDRFVGVVAIRSGNGKGCHHPSGCRA